jgi:hypothetical protein
MPIETAETIAEARETPFWVYETAIDPYKTVVEV